MDRARRFGRDDRLHDDFRLLQIESPYALASLWIAGGERLRGSVGDGPVNTWDVPRLELTIVRAMMGSSEGSAEQENLDWIARAVDPAGMSLRGEYDREALELFQVSSGYLLRGYRAGGGIRDPRPGLALFREGLERNPDDRRLRWVLRQLEGT
jgi:hypothetical protein